ncbi:related to RDS2 - Regulator of drug sensitivity [Ustilago trichophora]|uniref:Related to RDS2 - Regulator of drug sensitivity n=1 Tax=Ustilago trichophora TaxID=86804 RepID=A0A5C3E0H4_9BASI|nr:related to RDS2 - Regulator of drug sensitivity [Ustilago trichophora]
MHPRRSGYDPHTDHSAAEHRQAAMRDPRHPSPNDRRLPTMQPSGLPHGHSDLNYDYPNSRQYHTNPSTSRDQSSSRSAQHPINSDRYPPEQAQLPHPRSYPDRSYDNFDGNNDPRSRPQYYDERSPRHLAPPPYNPQHSTSPESQHHHQQQHPHYHDHPPSRHHQPHAYQAHPHSDQTAAYAPRDARADDHSRSHGRPDLPSPRDYHRPAGRISPSNDMNSRDTYPDHARYASASASSSHHDGLHRPDMHHSNSFTSSHPSTSSSSNHAPTSTPARSTPASRKRKKQFKYMLEQDGADPSKPSNVGGADDDNDADRTDNLDTSENAANAPQRKESRKKVKKACIFCKRSHMPCEEARPCKRCVKRGISHLCRDAEPVGSAGAASSSASSTTKTKFEEARDQARARRRRDDEARINADTAQETESGSDAESLASSAASSFRHRFGPASETGSLASSRGLAFDMHEMPGATARDPDYKPTMPISLLLGPENVELVPRPPRRELSPGVSEKEQEEAWNRSMDLSTQHKMKQMLEAGPSVGDLSDIFGEIPTSLLMTPAMANLPQGQSILRSVSAGLPGSPNRPDRNERDQRLKRSQSLSSSSSQCEIDEAGFKLPPRPKHLLQEEMATTSALRGGPPTYSYTYGYAKLARWMHTRFSRASCEEVDRSLSVFRPKLMALSRSLPESELISVEDSFYKLLAFYQAHVLEAIPVPMLVGRRTGEIYAVNSHAAKLFQLPESIFEGGQVCHYQLVTERDCVSMWGKWAKEAGGKLDMPPSQKVTMEVDRSLLLFNKPGFDPRTGETIGDGLCEDGSPAVVRREMIVTFEAKISKHGLPFMVIGTMTPIPDDES